VAWRISTVALRSSVEKEYGNGNGDHRTGRLQSARPQISDRRPFCVPAVTKWFCVQVQIWRKNVEPVRTRFWRLFVVANLLVPHLMIVDLRNGFHLKEKGKNSE
jgi:hypothetical protein